MEVEMDVRQLSHDDEIVTPSHLVMETLDNMLAAKREWLKETDERMKNIKTLMLRQQDEREQHSEKIDKLKRHQDEEYKDYARKYDTAVWKIDAEVTHRFLKLFDLQCKRDALYEDRLKEFDILKRKQKEEVESYMKHVYEIETNSDVVFERYGRELFNVKGRLQAEREYHLKAMVTLKREVDTNFEQDVTESKPFELNAGTDSEQYPKGLHDLKSKRIKNHEELLKEFDQLRCKQQDEYKKIIEKFHTNQIGLDEEFVQFWVDLYEVKLKWDAELEPFLKGMVTLNEKHVTELFCGLKEFNSIQAVQIKQLEDCGTELKNMALKSDAMKKRDYKEMEVVIMDHFFSLFEAIKKLVPNFFLDVTKPTSFESSLDFFNKIYPDIKEKMNLPANFEHWNRAELEVGLRETDVQTEEIHKKKRKRQRKRSHRKKT